MLFFGTKEILRLFEILLGRTEIRKILINKLKNKIRINYSEICEKIEYFENNYLSDALENQIHYLIDLRDHLHDTKPYQSGKFQFCLIQSENKEKIFKKILKNCELKEDIYHTKYSIILQSATPPIHTSNFASTTSSEENSIHSAPSLLSCVNPIPDSSAPIPQTTISPSSTSIDLNSMQSNSFNASNMNDSSKFNASSSRRKQKFDETIELQIIQQINDLQEEIEFLQIQLRKSQKSNTTIQPPPLQSLSARSHPQSEPEITPVNRSTSLNESMYAQDLSKNHLPTVNASFPHSRDTRSFSIGGAIHYSNNDIISTIPIIPATSSNHSTSTLPNECSNHPSRLKSGSQTGLSASHPLRNQSKSKVPNNEPVVTTEGSALAEKRTSVTRSGSGLQNLIEDIQSNEEIMNNMRVNPPKRNKSTESLDKSGKQTLPSPSVARNTKIMNNNASNSPKISHRTTGSGSGEHLKTKLKNKIKIPGKINLKKKNKGKRGMNFKVEEEEGKKEMSNREKKRSGSYFIENKRETITYNNYIDPSVREKRSLLNSQEIAAKGSPGGGKGSIITTSISNNDIDFLRQREEEKNSNSVNKYLLSHSKSDIQLSNYNEDDIHLSASMSILEELENDKRVIKPIFRTASAPKYLTISDMDQLNSLIPPLSPPTLPSSKSSTLSEHPNHKGNAGGKTNDASGGIVNNSPLHSPGKKEPLGSLNEYNQSMIESTGMELPNIDSFDYSFPNRNKMLNVNMKEEMSLAYSPPPNHRMSMYLKPKAKKTKIPPILDSKTQKSNSESSIMWPSGKTNQTHAHTQQLYRAHASESTLPSSHNQAWNEEIIANQEARNVQTIGSGSSNYLNEENVDFPKLPELLPASTIQFRRSLGSINYPQAAQHPSPPMDDGYPSLSSPTSTGIPHSRSSSSLLHLPLSEVSSIPIIPDSLASLLHSPLNLSNPSASPPTTPQNGYMYGPNSPLKSFSDPIKQSSGEGGIPLPIPNLEHVTLALNEGEPLDKITRMKLVSPPPVGAAASKVSDLTNPSLNRIKLSHVEDSELPAKCASEQDYPLENDGTPFSPISRSFSHHSFVFPAHSGSSAQLMGKRKERTKIKQILQEGGASTKLIFEENPQSRQGRGGSVVHPHPYQPPNPYHHHHQPLPSHAHAHAHAGGATPLSIVLPTTLPSVAPGGGGGSPTKAAMSKNRGRTSKKDDLDEINFNMSPGAGKRSDGISFEYEYTQESELYLSKLTSDSDLLKLMQQPNNLIKVSSEIQIEDGMGRTNQNNKPKVFDKIELNEEKELPVDFWFSHFFYGKFYETFLLRSPLDAILTFKKEKINKNLFYRILLRTKEQSSGILVPFSSLSFSRNSLRILSKYKLLSVRFSILLSPPPLSLLFSPFSSLPFPVLLLPTPLFPAPLLPFLSFLSFWNLSFINLSMTSLVLGLLTICTIKSLVF